MSVTRVFGKARAFGGALIIEEFKHDAPSRSGDATISVVIAPGNNSDEEPVITVVFAHHEGTEGYSWDQWEEFIEFYFDPERKAEGEYRAKDAEDMMEIHHIICGLVSEYKKL